MNNFKPSNSKIFINNKPFDISKSAITLIDKDAFYNITSEFNISDIKRVALYNGTNCEFYTDICNCEKIVMTASCRKIIIIQNSKTIEIDLSNKIVNIWNDPFFTDFNVLKIYTYKNNKDVDFPYPLIFSSNYIYQLLQNDKPMYIPMNIKNDEPDDDIFIITGNLPPFCISNTSLLSDKDVYQIHNNIPTIIKLLNLSEGDKFKYGDAICKVIFTNFPEGNIGLNTGGNDYTFNVSQLDLEKISFIN